MGPCCTMHLLDWAVVDTARAVGPVAGEAHETEPTEEDEDESVGEFAVRIAP